MTDHPLRLRNQGGGNEVDAMVVDGLRVARAEDPDGRLFAWFATNPDELSGSQRARHSLRRIRWREPVVRGRLVFADGSPPDEFYESPSDAAEFERDVLTYRGLAHRLVWFSGDAAQAVYSEQFEDWP